MKNFLTKKNIVYLSIAITSLFIIVILLIVPIGSLGRSCLVYSTRLHRVDTLNANYIISSGLSSPFTIGHDKELVLFWQTVVFILVSIIFVVFSVMFAIELKHTSVFKCRPTKAERLEARISALEHLECPPPVPKTTLRNFNSRLRICKNNLMN